MKYLGKLEHGRLLPRRPCSNQWGRDCISSSTYPGQSNGSSPSSGLGALSACSQYSRSPVEGSLNISSIAACLLAQRVSNERHSASILPMPGLATRKRTPEQRPITTSRTRPPDALSQPRGNSHPRTLQCNVAWERRGVYLRTSPRPFENNCPTTNA